MQGSCLCLLRERSRAPSLPTHTLARGPSSHPPAAFARCPPPSSTVSLPPLLSAPSASHLAPLNLSSTPRCLLKARSHPAASRLKTPHCPAQPSGSWPSSLEGPRGPACPHISQPHSSLRPAPALGSRHVGLLHFPTRLSLTSQFHKQCSLCSKQRFSPSPTHSSCLRVNVTLSGQSLRVSLEAAPCPPPQPRALMIPCVSHSSHSVGIVRVRLPLPCRA